ncbi:MAG: DUF971 domain-containing protein [Pseudomonadota bacterium]
MRPDRLEVTPDARTLRIHWPDREPDEIPAATLRAEARDAASQRARLDGALTVPPDIAITAMEAVGAMGVNIAFSDGHDRAIYPWPYLREIAAGLGN